MPRSQFPFPVLLTLLVLAFPNPGKAQASETELKLMTFNIRYGTADDGANAWEHRRELVTEIIRREDPHILAIQEGLAFQLEELAPALDGYRKLGQHRDGGLEGEFSGLYVKEDPIRLLDWGEMWLSPTPDAAGSLGWDAALPRMAVWVEVQTAHGGGRLRIYGTHFDHRGEVARVESARLLTRHAEAGPPAVIMGDLNVEEGTEALEVFFESGYRSAFTTLHPESELGTFNGFRDPKGGGRIDHILLGAELEAWEAAILTHRTEEVWASDHYPVMAVVSLAGGSSRESEGTRVLKNPTEQKSDRERNGGT